MLGEMRGIPASYREGCRITIDLDHAMGRPVIRDASLGPDLLQRAQAVEREAQIGERIALEPVWRAIAQEGRAPAQHMRQRAGAKQHRRILAPEPLEDLERHPRLRPGLDLARVDHRAIAETRL